MQTETYIYNMWKEFETRYVEDFSVGLDLLLLAVSFIGYPSNSLVILNPVIFSTASTKDHPICCNDGKAIFLSITNKTTLSSKQWRASNTSSASSFCKSLIFGLEPYMARIFLRNSWPFFNFSWMTGSLTANFLTSWTEICLGFGLQYPNARTAWRKITKGSWRVSFGSMPNAWKKSFPRLLHSTLHAFIRCSVIKSFSCKCFAAPCLTRKVNMSGIASEHWGLVLMIVDLTAANCTWPALPFTLIMLITRRRIWNSLSPLESCALVLAAACSRSAKPSTDIASWLMTRQVRPVSADWAMAGSFNLTCSSCSFPLIVNWLPSYWCGAPMMMHLRAVFVWLQLKDTYFNLFASITGIVPWLDSANCRLNLSISRSPGCAHGVTLPTVEANWGYILE